MNFVPDPIAFTVFGIGIRWYAILICAGILLGGAVALRRCASRNIKQEDYLDGLLWAVPLGIVGARAWYVIFEWENYHSFFDVINTRAGGLAIQGGLIAAIITILIVCRVKKMNALDWLDVAVPSVALGQAIGRWGNYMNQEAYGTKTDLPWAIMINGDKVHPTFLYESIWCLILFILLSAVLKRSGFRGQTLCLYLMLYSVERLLVEQLRTDSLLAGPEHLVIALKRAAYDPAGIDGVLHIGDILIFPFRTAQFLSLAAIAAGAVLYFIFRKKGSLPEADRAPRE